MNSARITMHSIIDVLDHIKRNRESRRPRSPVAEEIVDVLYSYHFDFITIIRKAGGKLNELCRKYLFHSDNFLREIEKIRRRWDDCASNIKAHRHRVVKAIENGERDHYF